MKKIILLPLLFAILPLRAEVFSLWDFSNGDAWASDSPDEVLSPAKIREEKIIADGREMNMTVSMIRTPLENCLQVLRKRFPKARFAVNQNSLLMEMTLKNGNRQRVYMISVDGVYPVLSFSMILPPAGEKKLDWPREFPMPPGGKAVSVIRFSDRNAVYGSFKTDHSISNSLGYIASSLKSSGWKAVTVEHQAGQGGTGEIFLNADSSRILILGFVQDKNGAGCLGTIYTRPVKK